MSNLAELWEERQKRKVKPCSRYGNAGRYCREINLEKREERNSNKPLTSMIKELIPKDIKLKLERI